MTARVHATADGTAVPRLREQVFTLIRSSPFAAANLCPGQPEAHSADTSRAIPGAATTQPEQRLQVNLTGIWRRLGESYFLAWIDGIVAHGWLPEAAGWRVSACRIGMAPAIIVEE